MRNIFLLYPRKITPIPAARSQKFLQLKLEGMYFVAHTDFMDKSHIKESHIAIQYNTY